jgi:hypothetical protein
MRTSRLLLALALFGLVAGGVGLAFAQPTTTPSGGATTTDHPCAPAAGENRSAALAAWRLACARNMTELRRLAIESFNENRTLALLAHEDNLTHVRATFEDGKLAAYKDCLAQAAPFGRNASGPHGGALASCLHGKLPPLRDAAMASHQAERKAVSDALAAARDAAKAQFDQMAQAWLVANPRP